MKTQPLLLLAIGLACPPGGVEASPGDGQATPALFGRVAALDAALFDAFNHCDEGARLKEHAAYFSPTVEFYHDNGGVTWSRDAMIANTAKNACGKYSRELVQGSLRVYPIRDFGAISQGVHRFCAVGTGACEGLADFIMVWRQEGERWQVTRALSYGHRAATGEANAPAPGLRERLDALLPPLLSAKGVPSVSIARLRDGRISLLAAYGEQAAGVPATPGTLYNIASMAKPVSAEVVLRLVAQQRVSLDEPLSAHWVDPDLAKDPRHGRLTPRLSLSHQTGFANWRSETDGTLAFRFAPGEGYGYSGEGFEYLARFVERKTGQDFETLAQSLVFDPAGMSDTAYTRRDWFSGRIAQPVDREGRPLAPQVAARLIASDDLYSTPADYARFMVSLHARQGVDESLAMERARIQVSRQAELCTPARASGCPLDVGFGLGWEVFRFRDNTYLMHTGMDDGTFSLGYFSPTTGSGTIIFTSSQNGAQLVLPILDEIGEDKDFVEFLRRLAG